VSFNEQEFYPNKPKGSFLPLVVVALVSAILGGLLVSFFVPNYLEAKIKNSLPKNEKKTETINIPAKEGSSIVAIAQKVGPAVVGITTKFGAGDESLFGLPIGGAEGGSGSGVIFDKQGYIVTNFHVVYNRKSGRLADEINVSFNGGKKVKAKLIGYDAQNDLAVIKISDGNLEVVDFGDSSKLLVGETVVAIGNPLGEEFAGTVTAGIVSAINRSVVVEGQKFKLIQTDAAINPGNSGGALVNTKGEVIGINSAKIIEQGYNVEGIGFAIPINTVKPIIKNIIEKGSIKRPWIGITGGTVSEEMKATYKLPAGVFVASVTRGGPAEQGGLQSEDVIVGFNNKKIESMEQFTTEIRNKKVGDTITLDIVRGDGKTKLKLTLGEMPVSVDVQIPKP
jgi:serine protease Do